MAGPSDHELIAEIQAGRRDALGLLFDRYASPLYEFIYYITGDRDESARLLEHVFTRVPSAIAGMGDNETIRGWLYGLAGEASLSYLRLKDRLDALPPSDETAAPGLSGDIWQAARGIPGFMRAALVVEELHGLAPTEKARVLNVPRLEVPRLVEQARAAFTAQFDNEAGLQGRPLASQVDTDRTWGIRRRLPAPGSLFGYLPLIPLPETLARAIRAQITGGTRPVRPVPVPMPAPAPTRPPVPARPPISAPVRVQERPVREELQPLPPLEPVPTRVFPEGCSLPVILGALLIALIITGIAAIIGFSMVRDSTGPTIARVEPADKSSIPIPTGATTARVILTATFRDDRAVNFRTVRLILDGQDVTGQTVVSNTGLSYPTDLPAGAHIAYLELFDNSGNKSSMLWQFTVLPPVEPTATPTMTPLPTAIATTTRVPSATPTGTPQPPVITTFTASQISTRPGVPVQLTWAVTNAESVFLNQEKVTLTGTRAVTPSVTTTYHLIATNAGGTIDRTVTITVTAAPDLTVTDISIGAGATVVYTIKNIGVGDITQMFLIQVLADGAPIDSNRRITSLAAGQEASLTVPNYTLLGTHMITVRVNGTQEIPEASFTNNELTRSLVGPTPTPTITLTPTRTNTPPPPTTAPTHTPTSTPTFTPTFTPTPTRTRTSTSAP